MLKKSKKYYFFNFSMQKISLFYEYLRLQSPEIQYWPLRWKVLMCRVHFPPFWIDILYVSYEKLKKTKQIVPPKISNNFFSKNFVWVHGRTVSKIMYGTLVMSKKSMMMGMWLITCINQLTLTQSGSTQILRMCNKLKMHRLFPVMYGFWDNSADARVRLFTLKNAKQIDAPFQKHINY